MIGIILWAIVIFILAAGYFDNLWLVLVILACSFIAVILGDKYPITKAGKEEKRKRDEFYKQMEEILKKEEGCPVFVPSVR